MEDTIVEILEISIKCRTSRDEVKTIMLTDFISPQRITLEAEEEKIKDSNYTKSKKFTLTIEQDENE